MLPLLGALCFSECPHLTPYFSGKNATLVVPARGWQYFYASHPRDASTPFRLWVQSPRPLRVAAAAVPSCPNETTELVLETPGGVEWFPGDCALRTRDRVLAIGLYSHHAQAVQLRLPAERRMGYGSRKALELLVIFLFTAGAALAVFCFYMPSLRPKLKQD
jgi:hypothetical protein